MTALTAPAPGPETAQELAARYGLEPSSHRPTLRDYVSMVLARRHFIVSFAQARTTTMYAKTRLGALWQVLTPLLQAALYYLIFGMLLNTHKGTPNFLGFLVTGVLIFHFINHGITNGSKIIGRNLALIRALHFPRACLPLASILADIQQLIVSMGVLIVIVLLTGEPITFRWLTLIPTLLLLSLFGSGCTMFIARIGANAPDISQLLPFLLRTWLYLSGVFYNINTQTFTRGKPLLSDFLYANPASVYIELARSALLTSSHIRPGTWQLAIFWAILAVLVGFIFFWRGEHSYGRG